MFNMLLPLLIVGRDPERILALLLRKLRTVRPQVFRPIVKAARTRADDAASAGPGLLREVA